MQILNEDSPTIKAVNPTMWIKKTNYLDQQFHSSLQAFTTQRADLLGGVAPLTPGAWSRKAIVTGAGKPRKRTVYTYALWLANHEHSHIRQVERITKSAGMNSGQ